MTFIQARFNNFKSSYPELFQICLIIFFPIIITIISNSKQIALINFTSVITLQFVFLLLLFLGSFFFKKNNIKILYILSTLWLLQYYSINVFESLQGSLDQTKFLKFIIDIDAKFLFYNIIKVIIFLYCILVGYLISKFYNNILKKFFLYFLLINIIFSTVNSWTSDPKEKSNELDVLNKAILKKFDTGIKEVNTVSQSSVNENIYFFLLDQMVSENYAKKEFGIEYDNYLKKLKSNHFKHFKNSRSFSKYTGSTISHIFFLNGEHKLSFLRGRVKQDDIPLIRILDQHNYKKYYFDNAFIRCDEAFIKYFTQCIQSRNSYGDNYKILILDNFISHNLFFNKFFSFKSKLLGLAQEEIDIINASNTELSRFKLFFSENKKIIDKKNNFFFVHNLGPHFPYRDINCKIISRHPSKNKNIENKNMTSSIKCAFKEMTELFNLIKKNDKSAYIIIQGDHGFSYYGIGERTKLRGQDIFSLVDYGNNSKCLNDKRLINTNIAAINSVLKCSGLIKDFK